MRRSSALILSLSVCALLPTGCGKVGEIVGGVRDKIAGTKVPEVATKAVKEVAAKVEAGAKTAKRQAKKAIDVVAEASDEAKEAAAPARHFTGDPATKKVAQKYKAWGVVHAFLGSSVVQGQVISGKEAIALTKDNHVGVTLNGGASWGFSRLVNGSVRAIAGAPGGPFVVSGKAGFMAFSQRGGNWRDLPRYTDVDLNSLAMGPTHFVAIGGKGAFVAFTKDGSDAKAGILPDKFKPGSLRVYKDGFLALDRKKAYFSKNGSDWNQLPERPSFAKGGTAATSHGSCAIGKVGKSKGVVCQVVGTGYGLGDNHAFVVSKSGVNFSANGGKTWAPSTLPFKGGVTIVGPAAGPYWALGGKGNLAVSTDGASWTAKNLNASKTLQTALFDGQTIVMVGDGGTIARSTDGGESWSVLPPLMKAGFRVIVKRGGKYIASDGNKKHIESSDKGATWVELMDPADAEGLPTRAKPGKCGVVLPAAGQVCSYASKVTTALGLPNVRSFSFVDDVGLAVGDAGLVAFTSDGGGLWQAQSGHALKGLQTFEMKGNTVVAVGKSSVVFSVDGGKTFGEAQLPKKIGKILTALIAKDGAVFLAGSSGTILKSTPPLTTWSQMDTGPKNKTSYRYLHEVNGVFYAAGTGGQLYRSATQGQMWLPLATGVRAPIQKMAGQGKTVVAVTHEAKNGGNLLLRSDDSGLHFYVQREISHQGHVPEFAFSGGRIFYRDRVTSDYGATWTSYVRPYWPGAVGLADGSGFQIAASRRYRAKDAVYIVGKSSSDWTVIDSFYSNDAWFRCTKTTGCWMVAGGQVYRPI